MIVLACCLLGQSHYHLVRQNYLQLAGNCDGRCDRGPTTHSFLNSSLVFVLLRQEVRFIDFDWGGREGEQKYPAFLNNKCTWPVNDPTEQLITQEHDRSQLEASLAKARDVRPRVLGMVHPHLLSSRVSMPSFGHAGKKPSCNFGHFRL